MSNNDESSVRTEPKDAPSENPPVPDVLSNHPPAPSDPPLSDPEMGAVQLRLQDLGEQFMEQLKLAGASANDVTTLSIPQLIFGRDAERQFGGGGIPSSATSDVRGGPTSPAADDAFAPGPDDTTSINPNDIWGRSQRERPDGLLGRSSTRDDRRKSRLLDERVLSSTASSGLEVRLVPRNLREMLEAKVEVPKSRRAAMSDHERSKLSERVIIALKPKFGFNQITSATSTQSLADYDIAEDSLKWQTALDNFRSHLNRFDLLDIFQVPNVIDLDDGKCHERATTWTDITKDFDKVSFDRCMTWQTWLNKWGGATDEESDRWVEGILEVSVEPTLKAEVAATLAAVDDVRQGAVVRFRLIAKLVFERNQEARETMVVYVAEFDIRKYDAQDVRLACTRLKAIARILGPDLPQNAVRRVLEGMSNASSPSFVSFCNTTSSMLDSSLNKFSSAGMTQQDLLRLVLTDVEKKYIELLESNKWSGVDHKGSAFLATNQLLVAKWEEACVLAARNNEPRLSFDEWKKTVSCHGCGDFGHIRPECPLKDKPDEQARRLRQNQAKAGSPRRPQQSGGRRPGPNGRFVAPGRPGATQQRRQGRGQDRRRLRSFFNQLSALASAYNVADEDDSASAASDDEADEDDNQNLEALNAVLEDDVDEDSSESDNDNGKEVTFDVNTARAAALGVLKE